MTTCYFYRGVRWKRKKNNDNNQWIKNIKTNERKSEYYRRKAEKKKLKIIQKEKEKEKIDNKKLKEIKRQTKKQNRKKKDGSEGSCRRK